MYSVNVDAKVLFQSEDKDEAMRQFVAAAHLARHPHGFATGREVILHEGDRVVARWSPDNPTESD